MVSLPREKAAKYLGAIREWERRDRHTLEDIQQLYGKLLHASLVVPAGRARLLGLECALGLAYRRPFASLFPPRLVRPDLEWWASLLSGPTLSRSVVIPQSLVDVNAYSDASTGTGIGVVIGEQWRAWQLLPGWRERDGEKDIGWAEAVGFYLLVAAVVERVPGGSHLRVYGDNEGVVKGWRNHRSRNTATNAVFKLLHDLLEERGFVGCVFAEYVPTDLNPADGPSRGIFPGDHLLLPPVVIPLPLFPLSSMLAPLIQPPLSLFTTAPPGLPLTPSERTGNTGRPSRMSSMPSPLPSSEPVGPLEPLGVSFPSVLRGRMSAVDPFAGDGTCITGAAADRVYDVLEQTWNSSTLETYGSGLGIFHAWCNKQVPPVPDSWRCAVDTALILEFIACCAGMYSGSTVKNYVYGVRAWHTCHALSWKVNDVHLTSALSAVERLAPPTSKKPKRPPATPEWLESIASGMDLASPFDAAVFACLCSVFWSVSRLGEFAVKGAVASFPKSKAPRRADLKERVRSRQGDLFVSQIQIPATKATIEGEVAVYSDQPGASDPVAAMRRHLSLNDPGPQDHLFAYRTPAGKLVPLTRHKVLARVRELARLASVPPLTGHSLRIGGVLVYLLRGIPFDVVKVLSRWASEAFTIYLREYADILAPYIQATPLLDDLTRIAMPARFRH
ncbi:hypothetical protein D9611_014088 [Ephemerocybe angulata]|uniref:Uncharacterized protein n=1 Tax=Ephemerocybe angulata TaxID=980116 RepID=A0A8H5F081_9AGAR|nr:hypothetical protein D9611_014088 [Tulosesus angulatus]